MRFESRKCVKNAPPRTPLGSLERSPIPPSWIWGREDRERVRDGKGGERESGGRERGKGGGRERGREGRTPSPSSKNSGYGLGVIPRCRCND